MRSCAAFSTRSGSSPAFADMLVMKHTPRDHAAMRKFSNESTAPSRLIRARCLSALMRPDVQPFCAPGRLRRPAGIFIPSYVEGLSQCRLDKSVLLLGITHD